MWHKRHRTCASEVRTAMIGAKWHTPLCPRLALAASKVPQAQAMKAPHELRLNFKGSNASTKKCCWRLSSLPVLLQGGWQVRYGNPAFEMLPRPVSSMYPRLFLWNTTPPSLLCSLFDLYLQDLSSVSCQWRSVLHFGSCAILCLKALLTNCVKQFNVNVGKTNALGSFTAGSETALLMEACLVIYF